MVESSPRVAGPRPSKRSDASTRMCASSPSPVIPCSARATPGCVAADAARCPRATPPDSISGTMRSGMADVRCFTVFLRSRGEYDSSWWDDGMQKTGAPWNSSSHGTLARRFTPGFPEPSPGSTDASTPGEWCRATSPGTGEVDGLSRPERARGCGARCTHRSLRQPLAGAGLREAHQVLELHVVVEFRGFVTGEARRLLPVDQVPDAELRCLGRTERHQLGGRRVLGDEFDQLGVREFGAHGDDSGGGT